MASVLQLRKSMTERSELIPVDGVTVRNFQGDEDLAKFLELRHHSFARQRVGVRQWTVDDFHQEFTNHWWWQAAHMWLAEGNSGPDGINQLLGSVTLAMRGEPQLACPAVHWLIVRPTARRNGIGRLLMEYIEQAAWDAGYREMFLETHAQWDAAVRFYGALGYRPNTREV